jgi:hypothetical protein
MSATQTRFVKSASVIILRVLIGERERGDEPDDRQCQRRIVQRLHTPDEQRQAEQLRTQRKTDPDAAGPTLNFFRHGATDLFKTLRRRATGFGGEPRGVIFGALHDDEAAGHRGVAVAAELGALDLKAA